MNGAVVSLNWMAGFKGASSSPSPGASTLDKHAALQQHLLREAHRRQAAAPQVLPKAEAALRELLRGQSVYETDSAPRNLVSYQPGKVSLPESVMECRFLEDIVSPDCRPFLEEGGSGVPAAADAPSPPARDPTRPHDTCPRPAPPPGFCLGAAQRLWSGCWSSSAR